MYSALESFFFIYSFGFSCFCHRVCSRTRKPQKFLLSKHFEVLNLYLIRRTFLSILCDLGDQKAMLEVLNKSLWLKFESSFAFS